MNIGADERRRDGRAPRPHAGLRLRIWRAINGLAEWCDRSAYQRTLLGALIALPIVAIGWALFIHLAETAELVSQIDQQTQLEQQIYDSEQKISAVPPDLAAAIAHAEARVVTDYGTLAGWLHSLQIAASALGLELSYVVNEELPLAERPGLIAVPIVFSARRHDANASTAYDATLALLQRIASGPWVGELVASEGEGLGAGLADMKFEYQIWMRAEQGFGPTPATTTPSDTAVAATGQGAL